MNASPASPREVDSRDDRADPELEQLLLEDAVRRQAWRITAIVAGSLVVLVGLVWVLGGFQAAGQRVGRAYASGETVELQRWQITVGEAWIEETYNGIQLVVSLDVLLTDEASEHLDAGLVTIQTEDGTVLEDARVRREARTGSFGPDIPEAGQLTVDVPEAPQRVRVVIRDETTSESLLSRSSSWTLGDVVGHVNLPVRPL